MNEPAVIKPEPIKAEIVTFTVKYMRYGVDMEEERETLEEAFQFSEYLHGYGEGFTLGIWEGDDELYNHEAWFSEIVKRGMDEDGENE